MAYGFTGRQIMRRARKTFHKQLMPVEPFFIRLLAFGVKPPFRQIGRKIIEAAQRFFRSVFEINGRVTQPFAADTVPIRKFIRHVNQSRVIVYPQHIIRAQP